MKKSIKLSIFLILGGITIGAIAFYGYMEAKKSKQENNNMLAIQQGLLKSQGMTGQTNSENEKKWIESDSCKMTGGYDADMYCNGIPDRYINNPDIDMNAVKESLEYVKECAIDSIRIIHGLDTSNPINDTQVKNFLCDIVDTYPKRSDSLDDITLQQSMYHIVNEFVNR